MTIDFDALTPEHIRSLAAYQPGKPVEELERELGITGAIKIASNENPMGPSPLAMEAAARALQDAHLYPDGGAHALRRAVSEHLGVAPDELVFGAGSNELIYLIVNTFCRPGRDEVLTHKYAFLSYRLASQSMGVDFVATEVHDDLRCDIDALIAGMSERTKVVFLANPNNPTGAHLVKAELERVLEAMPEGAILVVDEAYHEYAAPQEPDYATSQDYRTDARPLVITLRTFSKIHGLAGLRVGYGIGDRRLIERINRVRRPFNCNSVAQAAAVAALADRAHLERSQQAAASGIAGISQAAEKLGLRAYPSLTNFVLVGVGRDANEVYDALLRQGVIVRPMGAWGLPEHLRISVGTPAETERVAAALADAMK
jgi:histidinol-phosphate aminotransferase